MVADTDDSTEPDRPAPAVPPRGVALAGNFNLRDLGGYIGEGGRSVAWGRIFRSDELCDLTDTDVDIVATTGIQVVYDLRGADEQAHRPSRLPAGIERRPRPQTPSGRVPLTLEERVTTGDLRPIPSEWFDRVYVGMLEQLGPAVREIARLAAQADERPLLFHCTHGKDRTGIVAAILLGVLGVADDVIVADYELTTTYYAVGWLERLADLMQQHRMTNEQVTPYVHAQPPRHARRDHAPSRAMVNVRPLPGRPLQRRRRRPRPPTHRAPELAPESPGAGLKDQVVGRLASRAARGAASLWCPRLGVHYP